MGGKNMENKQKEMAVVDFLVMIKKSWAWRNLTNTEQETLCKAISWAQDQKALSGTYAQRWIQLQAIYNSFLLGIGYPITCISWRD